MFRDIDNSIDARDVFITRVGFGNRRAFAFVGFGDASRFDSKDASVPTLDAVVSSASANAPAVMFTTPGWSNPRSTPPKSPPVLESPAEHCALGVRETLFRIFRISLNTVRRAAASPSSETRRPRLALLPPRRERGGSFLLTKYFGSKSGSESRAANAASACVGCARRAPRARRRTPARRAGRRARPKRSRRRGEGIDPSRNAGGVDAFPAVDASPRTLFLRRRALVLLPGDARPRAPRGAARQESHRARRDERQRDEERDKERDEHEPRVGRDLDRRGGNHHHGRRAAGRVVSPFFCDCVFVTASAGAAGAGGAET